MKTGILLVNLGSPNGPEPADVGPYLRQFLMDPYVIDLPNPFRWVLVNAVIVPFRKYRSAEAYKKIWTEEGSPLVTTNIRLKELLRVELGDKFQVELGMRYGSPSIEDAMHELRSEQKNLDRIILIPLYPQYAASSSETAIQETMRIAKALGMDRKIEVVPPFYDQKSFIGPLAELIEGELSKFAADHLLFSYHGLPMRAVAKTCDTSDVCFASFANCGSIDHHNKNCYRAQCYATTKSLLANISFPAEKSSVAFQSRLTKNWIQPFSDQRIVELAQTGVKKLAVVCPSFTADCLETLEEVAIGLSEEFKQHGGDELRLIPALNESIPWVKGLSSLVRESKTL